MKITIATGPTYPFPPVGAAGVQKVFLALAREFSRLGHDVTVFARSWPGQPETEEFSGIRIVRWGGYAQGLNIWSDLGKDFIYAARAFRRVPSADVVVTNDFWLPFMLKFADRGALVVAAHRFPKQQYRLYRHARAVIAVSRPVAKAIRTQEPSLAERVFTINNPVDTQTFSFRPRVPGEKCVIGVLGRIHPEKGVHLLLESTSRLVRQGCPVEVRIAGPWRESQGGGGERYWRTIQKLSVGLPVEISGPLEDSELPGFFRSLDVFCLPSLGDFGEAMPLAPLEAMACGGVPVVSKIEAFFEYIENGKNGLAFDHHAEDPAESLTQALRELIARPEQRQRMSVEARATAERFAVPAVALEYLEVFKSL
jgi:glycosyltransferase involved in cell wall biosynthesis